MPEDCYLSRMILFNITHIISDQKVLAYTEWLKTEYIPLVKAHSLFEEIRLLKILDSPNEGHSFSLQLLANNREDILKFKESLFTILQQKMQGDFYGHLFLFDTLMEYID
ncbi:MULTISPECIES: DUF4286 family protein [Olivibacter]|jgi:hypothetical protein|uniref:DUF4286 family protein n=1 Tax=Olivibacter oleidegradans TaxID=760123 RepID=A0ABV6HFN3_9SPHI|nr:DUF4286 family protein [Olivibacter sp. LS-1]